MVLLTNDREFHLPLVSIAGTSIVYWHVRFMFGKREVLVRVRESAMNKKASVDFISVDVKGMFLDKNEKPCTYRTRLFSVEWMGEMKPSSKRDALICSIVSL